MGRVPRWLVLLAVVGGNARADEGGSAELRFRVGPVPAWVAPVAAPLERKPPPDAAGSYSLLIDRQTRYDGPRTQHYFHHAELVLSPTGIDDASMVRGYFEPSYEELTLHYVRVHRDGRPREALDRRQVRLAHVEDDLHARMYHGMASAIFFVPDVRVGDVVEYAFTTSGDNPVFDGRALGGTHFRETYPIAHLHKRLLVPPGRRLQFRGDSGSADHQVRMRDGWQELTWDAVDVPALRYDPNVPAWHRSPGELDWSEHRDWSEVADWAARLYRAPPDTAAALRPLVDQLRTAHATPADRLVAATRFVQDEIRYLAIEAGPASHRPEPPARVLEQRFGDCKGKSALLAALLAQLGIPAVPALVDSRGDRELDSGVASPHAFNHVIVLAHLDGRDLWIDPTDSMARGREFRPPPYRWALPVDPGTRELVAIPAAVPDRPQVEAIEEYQIPAEDGQDAALLTITRLRDDEADGMRRRLSSDTVEDVARGYHEFYDRYFPGIRREGEVGIEDDPVANEIVIRERYTIPGFWQDGKRDLYATEITGRLTKPASTGRTMPLAVAHPVWVRHELVLRMPEGLAVHDDQEAIRNRFFELEYTARREGGSTRLTYELKTATDVVAAGDAAEYAAAVTEAEDLTARGLDREALSDAPLVVDGPGPLTVLVAIGFGVGLLLAIFLAIRLLGGPTRVPPVVALAAATAPVQAGPTWTPGPAPAPTELTMPAEAYQSNGWGVAATWLGITGLLLLPWAGGGLIGLLATVFGAIGLSRASKLGGVGFGRSLAGVIMGGLSMLGRALLM